MGTLFSLVFVVAAAGLAFMGWQVVQEPETGLIVMDATWFGSWLFVGSLSLLGYGLVTFFVLLVALRRYWTCRADHRPFSLGAYMLMPIFPMGTIFAIFALGRLNADNKSGEQSGSGRPATCPESK